MLGFVTAVAIFNFKITITIFLKGRAYGSGAKPILPTWYQVGFRKTCNRVTKGYVLLTSLVQAVWTYKHYSIGAVQSSSLTDGVSDM